MGIDLPDSDQKFVLFCQQSFQPVLTVLLHGGYFFFRSSASFLAERSFKKESVKIHYFIKLICYYCP